MRVRPLPGVAEHMVLRYQTRADIPALSKFGVLTRSQIKITFVIEDTIVEHMVVQNAVPFVKPSWKRCWIAQVATVTTFSISQDAMDSTCVGV